MKNWNISVTNEGGIYRLIETQDSEVCYAGEFSNLKQVGTAILTRVGEWGGPGEVQGKPGTSFPNGTIIAIRPCEGRGGSYRYIVTGSSPNFIVLWNGAAGPMSSRPALSRMPDGTWANSSGIRYTVTGVGG